MSEQQIKPCPFCGRPGQLSKEENFGIIEYAVSCGIIYDDVGCFASKTYDRDGDPNIAFLTPEEAIEAWNKRATPMPKFKVGDVVVVTSTMPNFKMTINHVLERDGVFQYTGKDYYREENEIELFDTGKKYHFTA